MDELADPVDDFRLAALQVADEVPAKGVAVDGVLRLEILRTVLADYRDPGLGQDRHLLDGHVFRGCDDRHPLAELAFDLLVASPDLVRRQRYASSLVGQAVHPRNVVFQPPSNISCDRGEHSLHPARLPVPAMREKELRMTRGALIEAVDPVHARSLPAEGSDAGLHHAREDPNSPGV